MKHSHQNTIQEMPTISPPILYDGIARMHTRSWRRDTHHLFVPSYTIIKILCTARTPHKPQAEYFLSQLSKSMLVVTIVILSIIINYPRACSTIPTLSGTHDGSSGLAQRSQLLHQSGGNHASLVSPNMPLAPTSRDEGAQFDDQDQSTYQKVPVGRAVSFKCGVKNIGKHKLSWFHKDRHTFLAFHDKVVLNNGRIKVSSQADTVFYLHIDNVQLTDKGQIMCQLNTNPMKSQVHTLNVVESPHIIDHLTSSNLEPIKEGAPVSLRCGAGGLPPPEISWRRELDRIKLTQLALRNSSDVPVASSSTPYWSPTGTPTPRPPRSSDAHTVKTGPASQQYNSTAGDALDGPGGDAEGELSNKVITVQGQYLNISRVDRRDMGFYVCIASNGVPTSVSRRIFLPVAFGPMLTPSKHQKLKPSGRDVVLYCNLESYPKASVYWKFNGQPLFDSQLVSGGATSASNAIQSYHSVRLVHYRQPGSPMGKSGAATVVNSDNKYEMSIMSNNNDDNDNDAAAAADDDNHLYKSIVTLKIKDFQQTDYGVYICAAKNSLGEAQAKINVLPKDYTRLVPIVTTTTVLPPNMILNQHRLQHQDNNRTGSHSNNNTNNNSKPNIYTVNGAKFIQIGAASSVSLSSLVPQPPQPASPSSASAPGNNNRIVNTSNDNNNSLDLKTNTNKYNLAGNGAKRPTATTTNNNRGTINRPLAAITNGDGGNQDSDLDAPGGASFSHDTDDNHLDIRLDLDDSNLDLQLQQQSSSATSGFAIRRHPLIWVTHMHQYYRISAVSLHDWVQVCLATLSLIVMLEAPYLFSMFIGLHIYA